MLGKYEVVAAARRGTEVNATLLFSITAAVNEDLTQLRLFLSCLKRGYQNEDQMVARQKLDGICEERTATEKRIEIPTPALLRSIFGIRKHCLGTSDKTDSVKSIRQLEKSNSLELRED